MSNRSPLKLVYYLIKSARPRQWVKNVSLYAALAFSGFFFYMPAGGPSYFITVTKAFLVFCVLTSSIYLLNDVIDKEADKKHPFKSKRPIAAGLLPVPIAVGTAILGLLLTFIFSHRLGWFFQSLTIAYFALQIFYVYWLKNLPIFDVVSIAAGFLFRIYAGAAVVNLHTSVWFLLTVISASMFLAIAKRQSELTLLKATPEQLGGTRKILTRYSQRLLDQYTSMFATATWLSYALFAFQHNVVNVSTGATFTSAYSILPKSLHSYKLLMLSLPFVIFAVMRYLQLVYENNRGESPDQVLFKDKPMLITVISFIVMVMLLTYGLP